MIESLNQNLAAINSWCLKWHTRLSPKKTKFMVDSWFWKSSPGYGDLTLGGDEIEDVKSLHILEVPFD